jgi:predicted TIM-barrel fold metal-dependent hydrolase
VDHILAGSDYPHQIGSLRSMLQSLRGLDLSRAQQVQILGGNAARLLGLGAG